MKIKTKISNEVSNNLSSINFKKFSNLGRIYGFERKFNKLFGERLSTSEKESCRTSMITHTGKSGGNRNIGH